MPSDKPSNKTSVFDTAIIHLNERHYSGLSILHFVVQKASRP